MINGECSNNKKMKSSFEIVCCREGCSLVQDCNNIVYVKLSPLLGEKIQLRVKEVCISPVKQLQLYLLFCIYWSLETVYL